MAEREEGGERAEKVLEPMHLEPSELGTKEYWDNLYEREKDNHAHDPRDEGTVWFDDSDAEGRIVRFFEGLVVDRELCEATTPPAAAVLKTQEHEGARRDGNGGQDEAIRRQKKETSFLDLGTGNGSMLLALREAGWEGEMLGVDYSAVSIDLAREVQSSRRRKHEKLEENEEGKTEGGGDKKKVWKDVRFETWDILSSSSSKATTKTRTPLAATMTTTATLPLRKEIHQYPGADGDEKWDVVLDKGTFDAISLSPAKDSLGHRVADGYALRVLPLVRTGGRFVITSCNWTERELRRRFEGPGDGGDTAADIDADTGEEREGGKEEPGEGEEEKKEEIFRYETRIEYPSFSFGGVKGQTISSVCFRKELRRRKRKGLYINM